MRRESSQLLALAAILTAGVLIAEDKLPNAKPVPRLQVLPLPNDAASIERDGTETARYHFGPQLKRPFLFPLIGPTGRSLTRMGHPRDPNSHSHHNSVWVSHHDVGGVDFWGDGGKGRIVQKRGVRFEDGEEFALIQTENVWRDGERTLLQEIRTQRFFVADSGEQLVVIDLELNAPAAITFGKTPFGLVGVRMAKTIGVQDGGGRILNSEGAVDEAEVLWKRAKWVDYSGPIARDVREGVTLFDHPNNPNHPTYFHVRNDGWMGASLTYDAERSLEPSKPLALRYGLWIHSGVPNRAAIDDAFTRFTQVGPPPKQDAK